MCSRGFGLKLKCVIFCCGMLFFTLASRGERVALWPEGKIPNLQPQQIAARTQDAKSEGFQAAENRMPHLDWYEPPAKKNGACLLLISGGGYQACSDGVWVDRVAE